MQRENGFTLVELLVTMAVAILLMTTGIPSFKQFVKDNRVSGEATKLMVALQVTRSEAVKRGSGTVICASTNQQTCSGDTNWSTGWISFSDLDQDGDLDGSGSCITSDDSLNKECIIRTSDQIEKSTLTASAADTASEVRFLPSGVSSNGPVTFTLKSYDCHNQQQRSITVTRQGHIFSTPQDCS
jgi:type IV fimbrial biogenesis protein FimT